MAKSKQSRSSGSEILQSAHNIWLAGLGSLALAEEEGGKLFRVLVERGRVVEDRLAKPVGQARRKVAGTVGEVTHRASATMKSIEGALDEHVFSAVGRLGIPSRDEVARLTARVEDLTRRLRGEPPKAKRTPKKRSSKTGQAAPRKKSKAAKSARTKTAKKKSRKTA